METAYMRKGDYQYPVLAAPEQPKGALTKYGLLREEYLKEHRRATLHLLLLRGELKAHLLSIQDRAEECLEMLVTQMSMDEEATEELKARDPLLWVRKMNGIQSRAEEIVLKEIIHA